jgi:dolichol-phosphate mannosyltransferase
MAHPYDGSKDWAGPSVITGRSGVLVILPILNEVDHITLLVNNIRRELAEAPHTVCIIDDGSTDGTIDKIFMLKTLGRDVQLIQRKKTSHGSQRGSALKVGLVWGLQHTEHKVFVEMDGDLSHRTEELKNGISLIEEAGYDVAIASKYVLGSRVTNRSFMRRLVSRVCSIAVGSLITSNIKDYSNGFRFYARGAAQVSAQHKLKYGSPIYLTEVLALWLRKGMRVVEFPSTYIGRNEGISKLRWVDLVKAGLAVFEIAMRFHLVGFESEKQSVPLFAPSNRETF